MTTKSVPHLLVYISGHGFGHVAQVAPVLEFLAKRVATLRFTIISTVSKAHLQSRINTPFHHIQDEADFGMKMMSALDVERNTSLAAYREMHSDWPRRVKAESIRIDGLSPDFVLSNVAYLPLAAAKDLGIPCAALCSLNWLDIFAHYCGDMPDARDITADMHAAYAAANRFLRITPGMDMASLDNLLAIGPIARLGCDRRDEINLRLGLGRDEKLVLVSMGGIESRSPLNSWPVLKNVRWLVPDDWYIPRADVSTLGELTMDFTDVLHSCDALICKPGYGSFAEAACNGLPVLYVSRHDWPEEPCLVSWLEQHGLCEEISRMDFESGTFSDVLCELLTHPRPAQVAPVGIAQAADYLLRSMSMASP